jgi:hypothetical protein
MNIEECQLQWYLQYSVPRSLVSYSAPKGVFASSHIFTKLKEMVKKRLFTFDEIQIMEVWEQPDLML